MTNRSGNIGTAGETAVVRYLAAHGWPFAERRRLSGSHDRGDVAGTPGIVWEVKAGNHARNASDGLVSSWLEETETERGNAGADLGVLVVARFRHNVREWWTVLNLADVAWLYSSDRERQALHKLGRVPLRVTLADACRLLHDAGYGDRDPDDAAAPGAPAAPADPAEPRQLFRDYLDPGTSEALEPIPDTRGGLPE